MVASTVLLPTIDLSPFLEDPHSPASLAEAQKARDALLMYSAFALKDPRVSEQENGDFLDLLEEYFGQGTEKLMEDVRPDVHYQVGATPQGTELPRCGRDDDCLELVEKMSEEDKPADFTQADHKWRFFWRIGEVPKTTKYPQLNASQVIPKAFPQWEQKMNHWGTLMHQSVRCATEVIALGFDLPRDEFVKRTEYGPHLLAPTGSDLDKFGSLGTVLAGFHTDLNFLTIHGKSRFPGLHIWTPSGKKLLVKIPDGTLLVQAGKQMEHLTAGTVKAGFHEVVVVPETLDAIARRRELNESRGERRPIWRISSTLFFHIASDQLLKPLDKFVGDKDQADLEQYPAMFTGEQVQRELGFIALAKV